MKTVTEGCHGNWETPEEASARVEEAFRSPDYWFGVIPRELKPVAGKIGKKIIYGKNAYYLMVKSKPNGDWFVGYTCSNERGDTMVWKFAEGKALNDAFADLHRWLKENDYA